MSKHTIVVDSSHDLSGFFKHDGVSVKSSDDDIFMGKLYELKFSVADMSKISQVNLRIVKFDPISFDGKTGWVKLKKITDARCELLNSASLILYSDNSDFQDMENSRKFTVGKNGNLIIDSKAQWDSDNFIVYLLRSAIPNYTANAFIIKPERIDLPEKKSADTELSGVDNKLLADILFEYMLSEGTDDDINEFGVKIGMLIAKELRKALKSDK